MVGLSRPHCELFAGRFRFRVQPGNTTQAVRASGAGVGGSFNHGRQLRRYSKGVPGQRVPDRSGNASRKACRHLNPCHSNREVADIWFDESAASTTLASTHPAALAVHSGSATDTPRPECAREMERTGASTPALIECCSGTATTGPNSNDPVFLHLSLATNSETSSSPSRPWSNATMRFARRTRALSVQGASTPASCRTSSSGVWRKSPPSEPPPILTCMAPREESRLMPEDWQKGPLFGSPKLSTDE